MFRPFVLASLLIALPSRAATQAPPVHDALHEATQLLLVTAAAWDAPTGTAQRYERGGHSPTKTGKPRKPAQAGGAWHKTGKSFPVVLGKGGLAWRSDEGAPEPLAEGPRKQEGDGRAPAGVMRLGEMWGYAEAAPDGVKLPYHPAGDSDRCVDDITAPQYGKLVPEPKGGALWKSAERMRRGDELYKYLIVVDYNMDHPRPGAGSCIFLHLQRAPRSPTVGCTAMAEGDLLSLARWLDPDRHPVLVQLPARLLPAARKAWGIP